MPATTPSMPLPYQASPTESEVVVVACNVARISRDELCRQRMPTGVLGRRVAIALWLAHGGGHTMNFSALARALGPGHGRGRWAMSNRITTLEAWPGPDGGAAASVRETFARMLDGDPDAEPPVPSVLDAAHAELSRNLLDKCA